MTRMSTAAALASVMMATTSGAFAHDNPFVFRYNGKIPTETAWPLGSAEQPGAEEPEEPEEEESLGVGISLPDFPGWEFEMAAWDQPPSAPFTDRSFSATNGAAGPIYLWLTLEVPPQFAQGWACMFTPSMTLRVNFHTESVHFTGCSSHVLGQEVLAEAWANTTGLSPDAALYPSPKVISAGNSTPRVNSIAINFHQ